MPYARVHDIRYIDWAELKNSGFKGVVFVTRTTLSLFLIL